MSSVARVSVGRHENQILVPSRGLFTHGGRPIAYVVTSRGIEPRYVSVAYRNDDVTAVASGLQPGERVAVAAPPDADLLLAALREGTE
jgi:cobalt-zinc-cadmium efflux system membrane fusion protein